MATSEEETFVCPACGFRDLTEPPWSEESGGSFEICPSCGIQFGYTDAAGGDIERRKQIWAAWPDIERLKADWEDWPKPE